MTAHPTEADRNLAALRQIYEAFDSGDAALLDPVIAEDCVDHDPAPDQPPGREGLRAFIGAMHAGFPDFRLSAEEMFAAGDRVVARFLIRGTHTGTFMGMPPSGRPIEVKGIDIVRFEGGVAVEHWGMFDTLTMLQQVGAVPADGAQAA
jgi:steroid delta-isomerase-like uncharacterized protein